MKVPYSVSHIQAPYEKKRRFGRGPPPGLINSLLLGTMYGYFALNFDGDPNDCYANGESDDRVDQDEASRKSMLSTVNVGGTFSVLFKVLFFMTLVEVCISLFAYSISVHHTKAQAKPVFKFAVFTYAMASLIEVFIWIYLFILRFSHEGQVCSGDFLPRSKPQTGYVTAHGRCIKVVAIFVSVCFCCLCWLGPLL